MRLTVWILDPDPKAIAALKQIWRFAAGRDIQIQSFSNPPDELPAPLPDLLMAETLHQSEQVTQLLTRLRQLRSVDFLPVTSDPSASAFTRAQQLGAIDYILKPFTAARLRMGLRRYLTLKQSLTCGLPLRQEQLDRLFFPGQGRKDGDEIPLPKSGADLCRRSLTLILQLPGGQTSSGQLAKMLDVSRVTARKYLEILRSAGYLTRLTICGQSGRPRYQYRFKGELSMKTIILATKNPGKVQEIKDMTGDLCQVATMSDVGLTMDIEETGTTFTENARIKAQAVWNARLEQGCRDTVISDDSGIEIDFFDRKPGIYSSRWLGETTPYEAKNRIVLERMAEASDSLRTARYVCAMVAILSDGRELSVLETVEGQISRKPAGANGFGYDPIFFIPEAGKTFAEMSAQDKHAISHRGKALRALKQLLEQEGVL